MPDNKLFEPSLEGETKKTQTYNIGKIFYAAFFGGIVPLVCLGTINCNSLKINKKITVLLAICGLFILIAKFVTFGMYLGHSIDIQSNYIKWGYRIASVLLYLAYYGVMKNAFNQHLVLGGTFKPLLKDAIIYMLVGMVVEAMALFAIGGQVLKNVF